MKTLALAVVLTVIIIALYWAVTTILELTDEMDNAENFK